jgi:hypothetical protein
VPPLSALSFFWRSTTHSSAAECYDFGGSAALTVPCSTPVGILTRS